MIYVIVTSLGGAAGENSCHYLTACKHCQLAVHNQDVTKYKNSLTRIIHSSGLKCSKHVVKEKRHPPSGAFTASLSLAKETGITTSSKVCWYRDKA